MNILDTIGQNLLQQHEGGQQLAFALASSARALMRRLGRLFGKALRSAPGEHQLP